MRLPGAAMLIVIGMLVLWLAITGKLDRLAASWDYLKGNTDALPASGGSAQSSNLAGVLDQSSWHMQNMVNTLSPTVELVKGGLT